MARKRRGRAREGWVPRNAVGALLAVAGAAAVAMVVFQASLALWVLVLALGSFALLLAVERPLGKFPKRDGREITYLGRAPGGRATPAWMAWSVLPAAAYVGFIVLLHVRAEAPPLAWAGLVVPLALGLGWMWHRRRSEVGSREDPPDARRGGP